MDQYQVPIVFHDGKGAFRRIPNPTTLWNPADPDRSIAPERYSWHTVVTARTPVNDKQTPLKKINELIEQAEDVFAKSRRIYDLVALISGMPIHLRTNSTHLANFWGQNWYLGEMQAVEQRLGKASITLRAALDPTKDLTNPAHREALKPTAAAYFCPENRQIVFLNTDYYGQCKSWALGAAGVGLADFKIHSCHGAGVEIDGVGVIIIAPTGTGKSTYTNWLAPYGKINSDDWVYIEQEGDKFIANPSERYIYVRSNVVKDNPEAGNDIAFVQTDPVMRQQFEIFERSPVENVPIINGRRVYNMVPNSRVLINPADISPMTYRTPVNLMVLLRRDDVSPYMEELDTDKALEILRKGEFMVQPGATVDPTEIGKLKNESWYNPYLLAPDDSFEAERFAAVKDQGGAKYLIFNTSSIYARPGKDGKPDLNELIDRTGHTILGYVSRFSGKSYR
ncbi:MAG: hypothetical protein ACE5FK_05250 [Candidatus Methylomirabilia bacterium]